MWPGLNRCFKEPKKVGSFDSCQVSNEGPAEGGWLCRSLAFEDWSTGSLKGAANASEPGAEKVQKETAMDIFVIHHGQRLDLSEEWH